MNLFGIFRVDQQHHVEVAVAQVTQDGGGNAGIGRVFTGCNVENGALGSTICAERVAICKAVSEGETKFTRIAIYADSADYCMPCGTCRQVMSEFSQDMEVLSANGAGSYVSYRLDQLLPHTFKLRS